jgi:hypothetical protein
MTDHKQQQDDLTRIIVLVYAMLETRQPCWIYVAVKPSKYDAFMLAQKEGKLDLYHFDPFGEIIVSGAGKSPPDAITLKVAEMYQTDPTKLFQPVDLEEEVAKRMDEAAKKPAKKKKD